MWQLAVQRGRQSLLHDIQTVSKGDEATYNNMGQAMTLLNNKLFLKSHMSLYTEQDMDILDAYCTKPICGVLPPRMPTVQEPVGGRKHIEVDISKAYTAAFSEITEIPIFNEFLTISSRTTVSP